MKDINNIISIFFVMLLVATFNFSCIDPPPKVEEIKTTPHKYIVLLDLSDRILNAGQIERDTSVLSVLFQRYKEKVKQGSYMFSEDDFEFYIAQQQDIPYANSLKEITDSLCIKMSAIPFNRRKIEFDRYEKRFHNYISKLYNLANFNNDPKKYKGADIGEFFIDHLENDFLSKNDTSKKFVFIITDGYPIANNVSGPNPAALPNNLLLKNKVNILLLELYPNANQYNVYTDLKNNWYRWFNKIGVNRYYSFKYSTPINEIKKRIVDFTDTELKDSLGQISTSFIPQEETTKKEEVINVEDGKIIKTPKIEKLVSTVKPSSNLYSDYYKQPDNDNKLAYFLNKIFYQTTESDYTRSELKNIIKDVSYMMIENFPSKNKSGNKYVLCCSLKSTFLQIVRPILPQQDFDKLTNSFNVCP